MNDPKENIPLLSCQSLPLSLGIVLQFSILTSFRAELKVLPLVRKRRLGGRGGEETGGERRKGREKRRKRRGKEGWKEGGMGERAIRCQTDSISLSQCP